MAIPDNDGPSFPWVVPDGNLPTVTQFEDVTLESADAGPLFPPGTIHSLQEVRERLQEFLRGNEHDTVTEENPETQSPSLIANQSGALLNTLDTLARRRQEIIDEIEQSRQILALNRLARSPHQRDLATVDSFSNPATAQSVLPALEHLDIALAAPPVPDSIMPWQGAEERSSRLSENRGTENQASFVPPSLIRQDAFVSSPHANVAARSIVTHQAENIQFTPFSWPTQETALYGPSSSVQNVILPQWPNQNWQQSDGSQMVTQDGAASLSSHGGRDDFETTRISQNVILPTLGWHNPQDLAYPRENGGQSSAQADLSNEQHQPFLVPQHDQALPNANSVEQSNHILQGSITAQQQSRTPALPSGSGRQINQALEQETRATEQSSQNNTGQIWEPLDVGIEELSEPLDSLERHQAEFQSDLQDGLQTQMAELQPIFHPQARSRVDSQPEHSPTTFPPLPREPVDERTSDPDAPPTPGRRAPHIRQRQPSLIEIPQDSPYFDENEIDYELYLVPRRHAETEPESTVNINDNEHEAHNTHSAYSAENFPTASPSHAYAHLAHASHSDVEVEPDRLLSHYRTQGEPPSQPFPHDVRARSAEDACGSWPAAADPRSPAQRELDRLSSYLALMGGFADSRAELHRADDISSYIAAASSSSASWRSRHSRQSSRHHPYAHRQSWTTSAQILAPGELRSIRRSILLRAAYGRRSGFRDSLDDRYGPVAGEWLWWVWLGAAGGGGEDEEVGWVDACGRRVLLDGCEGEEGVSGIGVGRWVERNGVGGFEIGIPGLSIYL